jgi:hypothetical protein
MNRWKVFQNVEEFVRRNKLVIASILLIFLVFRIGTVFAVNNWFEVGECEDVSLEKNSIYVEAENTGIYIRSRYCSEEAVIFAKKIYIDIYWTFLCRMRDIQILI